MRSNTSSVRITAEPCAPRDRRQLLVDPDLRVRDQGEDAIAFEHTDGIAGARIDWPALDRILDAWLRTATEIPAVRNCPEQLVYITIEADLSYRLGDFDIPTSVAEFLYAAQRFQKREPERSRRALRLLFANWLAHVEIPELRQKRPAVRAIWSVGTAATSIRLYPVSPLAPAGARAISPQEVSHRGHSLFKLLDQSFRSYPLRQRPAQAGRL